MNSSRKVLLVDDNFQSQIARLFLKVRASKLEASDAWKRWDLAPAVDAILSASDAKMRTFLR